MQRISGKYWPLGRGCETLMTTSKWGAYDTRYDFIICFTYQLS